MLSVIKYFKNNSENVEHNYFRYNCNKYSVKILSKMNCKLKRYQIFSLEIKNTEKFIFIVYFKLYDLFTSLLLASTFISYAVKVNIPLDLLI